MADAKYKIGRRKGFTVVYRSVAQDRRLSLKARGLFLLLQSLPDDWNFTVSGIATFSGAGVRQVRAALTELENVGYLVREQSHADGGKFSGNTWILQEEAPEESDAETPSEPAPPLCQNVTTAPPENQPLCQNALTRFASAQNGTEHNTIVTDIIPPNPPKGDCACDSDQSQSQSPKANRGRAVKSSPAWKPERFEKFWDFYRTNVRGEDRLGAVREWDKLKPDDALIDAMGRALVRQVNSDAWRRGIGKPYAVRYLRKRRWEDDLDPLPPSVSADNGGAAPPPKIWEA